MTETLPWYKSRILMGVLFSAVLKLLVLTHVMHDLAPADAAAWLDVVSLFASFAGDAWAAHGRITQTTAATITATAKGTPTDA